MRRIERYLAAEVMRPAGGTLIGLVVVVLVFYASRILAQAVAEGFSIVAVTQLALLRLGIFMDVLVPAALVLGVVIGLGRLQTGHELTALAALGAGRYRILSALALPVLGLALLVAGVSLLYRPWAFATLYGIEAEVAARLDLSQVEPGRFTPWAAPGCCSPKDGTATTSNGYWCTGGGTMAVAAYCGPAGSIRRASGRAGNAWYSRGGWRCFSPAPAAAPMWWVGSNGWKWCSRHRRRRCGNGCAAPCPSANSGRGATPSTSRNCRGACLVP